MGTRERSNYIQFLGASEFCDCDNPEIRQRAKELIRDAFHAKEAAIRIFFFVRDKIKFGYPHLGTASEILKRGYGTCSSKANLQVAILRCIGVPARFRLQSVNARALFEDKVPSPFREDEFSGVVTHYSAEVYVEGRWLIADSTFDKEIDPQRAVDWNGNTDASILKEDEVLEELGIKENLDDVFKDRRKQMKSLSKQQGEYGKLYDGILNSYFELVRLRNKFLGKKP